MTPNADPSVIVGLACRVPGATNPSQLWENIVAQKDLQRKMPADRFNVDAFYHPDGTNKGTVRARSHDKVRTILTAADQRQIWLLP